MPQVLSLAQSAGRGDSIKFKLPGKDEQDAVVVDAGASQVQVYTGEKDGVFWINRRDITAVKGTRV